MNLMMKKVPALVVAILMGAIPSVFSQGVPKPGNVSRVKEQLTRVSELLAAFEKSKSADKLEEAVRAMEGTFPSTANERAMGDRKELTTLWLKLVRAVDQNVDPGYHAEDLKNAVALNLSPLRGADGVAYPSGVNPSVIKDERARAQYEAAIKENQRKAAKMLFQSKLRQLDQLLALDVKRYLGDDYGASKADQTELKEVVDASKLSKARKSKLSSDGHLERHRESHESNE